MHRWFKFKKLSTTKKQYIHRLSDIMFLVKNAKFIMMNQMLFYLFKIFVLLNVYVSNQCERCCYHAIKF